MKVLRLLILRGIQLAYKAIPHRFNMHYFSFKNAIKNKQIFWNVLSTEQNEFISTKYFGGRPSI